MIQIKFVTLFTVFCALVFIANGKCRKTKKDFPQQKLWDYIFCDFDNDHFETIIPVKDINKAINISLNLQVKSFNYNERSATFTVDARLKLNWQDEYIQWDPEKFNGITNFVVNDAYVWRPDIFLYNQAEVDSKEWKVVTSVKVVLSDTGHVTTTLRFIFKSICVPDLSKYPYDTQKCTLRFASRLHKGDKMNLEFGNPAFSLNDMEENKSWKLKSITPIKNLNQECCPKLDFEFDIQRFSGNHISTVVIPAFVLAALTLLSIWITSEKKDKFYLCFSNIILHFLYVQYITIIVPIHGKGTPNSFLVSRNSMFIYCLTILSSVLLRKLMRGNQKVPSCVSRMVSFFVECKFNVILLFENYVNNRTSSRRGDDNGTTSNKSSKISEWVILERIFNRSLFFIFLLVYGIMLSKYMI